MCTIRPRCSTVRPSKSHAELSVVALIQLSDKNSINFGHKPPFALLSFSAICVVNKVNKHNIRSLCYTHVITWSENTRIGYRRNSHALIMVQYRPNCDDRMIVPTIWHFNDEECSNFYECKIIINLIRLFHEWPFIPIVWKKMFSVSASFPQCFGENWKHYKTIVIYANRCPTMI